MTVMQDISDTIDKIQGVSTYGKVSAVKGLLVESLGIDRFLSLGSRAVIYPNVGGKSVNGVNNGIMAEVVGFRDKTALLMPYSSLDGVGPGAKVEIQASQLAVAPSPAWLGRVIDAFGRPIDGKGPIIEGGEEYPLKGSPINSHNRMRVGEKVNLGIKSINTFASCCEGQRMGIFAGSGVGKSIIMSMLARYSTADINVIGLVGERGREVQEFIQDDLGEEGLKRSVVVVATSDEYALMRRQAAYMTMTIAEYFRDQGKHVLCMMDSITRFAMAQREIGLSAGEPPTSKGYTPTVFSELPKLLERAGPGAVGSGYITGLFTVLVEGDDTNEPVSDAVRGILDGHILLDRNIAQRGRYPAVNVLKSVSRTMPHCNTDEQNQLIQKARDYMTAYEDMAEMIRLGAYRKGADATIDKAIELYPKLEEFLNQTKDEGTTLDEGYAQLAEVLGVQDEKLGGDQ